MSVSTPSWRLVPRGHFLNTSLPIRTRVHQTRTISRTTPRSAADGDNPSDNAPQQKSNPIVEEYLRKYKNRPAQPAMLPGEARGDLPASSIFEDDRRAQDQALSDQAVEDKESGARTMDNGLEGRNPRNMMRITDPDPSARERWERKRVIQLVRREGRLTKQEIIKRTEREHLVKSHNLKTSVKKLGMLARQIQGKTIDDAITQMQFSNKKVATEVLKQLEFARDEAVVMRGMGLGNWKLEEREDLEEGTLDVTPDAQESKADKSVEIQLKDGKRHQVSDPSKIYIDQAWVGRGPYGKLPDYRARGQINIMWTPWTSITLLLKEETTRVREYAEREAKRRRQTLEKVWVHLPDRPIQTKRQWYSW